MNRQQADPRRTATARTTTTTTTLLLCLRSKAEAGSSRLLAILNWGTHENAQSIC